MYNLLFSALEGNVTELESLLNKYQGTEYINSGDVVNILYLYLSCATLSPICNTVSLDWNNPTTHSSITWSA